MAVNGVANPAQAGTMASRVAGEGAAPTDVRANKARETGKLGAGEYAKSAKRVDAPAAEVSISPRARELAAATRAVRETPDVREDKVEHYKKLIQNGEYKVDAGKVADGIAREAIRDDLSSEPEIALA